MAKKRQGGPPGSGSGHGSGKPNWKPYLAVLAIVAAIAAFYNPFSDNEGSTDSSPSEGALVSSADLENELRRLHAGLAAVAGRGGSSLFGKLKAMADQAMAVLEKAAAAPSEDERKQILLEGLRSKAQWMSTLQDHALGLKKDGEDDTQAHSAPQAEGAVVALTRENFTQFVAANSRTMVEFYATWCPHCRKFAPEYAACADHFHGRAAFAIVDGEKESQLTRVYKVGGYPTLKWMVNGRAIDYQGPPKKEELSKWVEQRLTPAYVDLDSVDDAATVLEQVENKQGRICAGEGTKDSKRFQAFIGAAEHFRGKMIFTWSPPASADSEGSLRLHTSGLSPDFCGAHAGGKPKASSCEDADEVIKWLDDRMDFDPDLG